MAFYTLDPVPTDGGVFNLTSDRFDWTALTDDKFLVVYQQNNPARLYAQVVNFNGTNAPGFGDAFLINSENVSDMAPIAVAVDQSRVLIIFLREAFDNDTDFGVFLIQIDANDAITIETDVNDISFNGPQDNLYDARLHEGTNRVHIAFERTDSFHEDLRNGYVEVDTNNNTISSNISVFNNFDSSEVAERQVIMQSLPNGNVFTLGRQHFMIQSSQQINGNYIFYSNDASGGGFFQDAQCAGILKDGLLVQARDNELRLITYENNNIDSTNITGFFSNTSNSPRYFLRIDDEHCMILTGRETVGNTEAYVLRIPDYTNYISNSANPITINNGIIDTNLFANRARGTPLHITSTQSRIHYTGIVDDGSGGTTIGFHIFTP